MEIGAGIHDHTLVNHTLFRYDFFVLAGEAPEMSAQVRRGCAAGEGTTTTWVRGGGAWHVRRESGEYHLLYTSFHVIIRTSVVFLRIFLSVSFSLSACAGQKFPSQLDSSEVQKSTSYTACAGSVLAGRPCMATKFVLFTVSAQMAPQQSG